MRPGMIAWHAAILLLASLGAAARQVAASAAGGVSDDPVPHFPRAFSIEFNETTKLLLWTWTTEGAMFYDADQQAELVYRANGRGDRYCGSVHPRVDTPCTHLVVGGMRYLIFPGLGDCCSCCSAASGCGILDPDWLAGAEYIGQVSMQGRAAHEWAIRGLQPNQYYASADEAEVPLELDQDPNDYMTFRPDTYKPGPVAPSVFSLPADARGGGCARACPLVSVCTIAALRGPVGPPAPLGQRLRSAVGAALHGLRWRRGAQGGAGDVRDTAAAQGRRGFAW